MKIVFIDVDGPLAWKYYGGRVSLSQGSEVFTIPYPWVQKDCTALLTILENTDARLVLSSDWRKHYSFLQMREIFRHYGIQPHYLVDTTTHLDLWKKFSRPSLSWERAAEILKWVRDNGIKQWIAIDDIDLKVEFKWRKIPQWRHVEVDGELGNPKRLRDRVDECIEKLNR
jgi:hypothetical protein